MPDVVQRLPCDEAGDLYGLGVTLSRLVAWCDLVFGVRIRGCSAVTRCLSQDSPCTRSH